MDFGRDLVFGYLDPCAVFPLERLRFHISAGEVDSDGLANSRSLQAAFREEASCL